MHVYSSQTKIHIVNFDGFSYFNMIFPGFRKVFSISTDTFCYTLARMYIYKHMAHSTFTVYIYIYRDLLVFRWHTCLQYADFVLAPGKSAWVFFEVPNPRILYVIFHIIWLIHAFLCVPSCQGENQHESFSRFCVYGVSCMVCHLNDYRAYPPKPEVLVCYFPYYMA